MGNFTATIFRTEAAVPGVETVAIIEFDFRARSAGIARRYADVQFELYMATIPRMHRQAFSIQVVQNG